MDSGVLAPARFYVKRAAAGGGPGARLELAGARWVLRIHEAARAPSFRVGDTRPGPVRPMRPVCTSPERETAPWSYLLAIWLSAVQLGGPPRDSLGVSVSG